MDMGTKGVPDFNFLYEWQGFKHLHLRIGGLIGSFSWFFPSKIRSE